MKRSNTLLAGALGLQLLLAGATWWPSSDEVVSEPLVSLEAEDIQRVRVWSAPTDEGEAEPVVLTRGDEGWVIESAGGYPAKPGEVEELLDSLSALRSGSPIASTAASHGSLKVAEDSYDKKVELSGDRTEVLYIGAGSGRSASVRRADEDAVYSASGLSQWSVGASPRDYWDASYLDVDPEDLERFSVRGPEGELSLERGADGAWTSPELEEGQSLDQQAVEDLLKKATKLRISAMPEGEPTPPELWVSWSLQEGEQSVSGGYAASPSADNKRAVKAEGSEFTVLVSSYSLDEVAEAELEDLLAD